MTIQADRQLPRSEQPKLMEALWENLSRPDSKLDSLTLYGEIHAKVFRCHRLLARRFPYAVYYKT